MPAYKGLHNTYITEREIGRGGEGQVFEIQDNPLLVAKLYTEQPDAVKTAKLRYMVSMQQQPLHQFAAWPRDLLMDAQGVVIGFTMKRLDGFVPLHMLFSPLDRKKLFPDKGYNFLAHVARNLSTGLHQLHNAGIVIGDINEGNILVDNKGFIAFIDCDSFQITNGAEHFFCEVGITRYTPPELLERGSFENIIRTINTDSFSLGILLFQLLFMGRHPFAGRNLTKEDIDEEKAIRTGEFAYSLNRKNKKLSPPLNSLDIRHVPDSIVQLFHQTFEKREERPVPVTWVKELDILVKQMSSCSQSKLHSYPLHHSTCPWCHIKNNRGPVYFLDDSYLHSIPELQNIEEFINGFKLEEVQLKKLPDLYPAITGTPRPISTYMKKMMYLHTGVLLLGIIGGFLLIPVSLAYAFLTGIAVLLYHISSPWKQRIKAQLDTMLEHYQAVFFKFLQTVKLYNQPPELVAYNEAATRLTSAVKSFRQLPQEFQHLKKQTEERIYQSQLHIFLQQFHLESHNIPSFGPAKKKSLYNNGIIHAGHISQLQTIKVMGIGPKNIQTLLSWQRQIATGFTYIPDYKQLERESANITREIASRKTQLEHIIQAEYRSLHYLKSQIAIRQKALEQQYEMLGIQYSEALKDYEAFKEWAGVLGR